MNKNFVTIYVKTEFCKNSIMVAVLILVHHVILCKFILYLKSQFWENNRSEPVFENPMQSVKLFCSYLNQNYSRKSSPAARKERVRVSDISLKKVRNLPFQSFHNLKSSLLANHGGLQYWRLWATLEFSSYAPTSQTERRIASITVAQAITVTTVERHDIDTTLIWSRDVIWTLCQCRIDIV